MFSASPTSFASSATFAACAVQSSPLGAAAASQNPTPTGQVLLNLSLLLNIQPATADLNLRALPVMARLCSTTALHSQVWLGTMLLAFGVLPLAGGAHAAREQHLGGESAVLCVHARPRRTSTLRTKRRRQAVPGKHQCRLGTKRGFEHISGLCHGQCAGVSERSLAAPPDEWPPVLERLHRGDRLDGHAAPWRGADRVTG